jgi:ATP-dependent DNA helicase RecQ
MSPPTDIHQVLNKYWGYAHFRPLQEEIIRSVIAGKDTLALLPTGGGKSLCYQVPGMAMEGLCLVVSPLIALMKDQVYQLRKRGIRCGALYAGQSRREQDVLLQNCMNGAFKFLYLSPERLAGNFFRDYLREMPVNLLAVDESHCISQWGYDFRPEYLRIAEVRPLLADIPVLAVTATATPPVSKDIMEKLQFKEEMLLKKSFVRENLHYVVQHEQDKLSRLENILKKVSGTGIVYVRSRRRTEEFARWLSARGHTAKAYHAGLKFDKREEIQKAWTEGVLRLVVATNAFGMGIDKPDVRWVVHMDIPDNPEAYFQEAGRGGRDEKKAYAILLFDEADIHELEERTNKSFPEIDFVRRVYKALGNYLGIAIGNGAEQEFEFDLMAFCKNYNLKASEVMPALKLLAVEGYLQLSDGFHDPSRAMVLIQRSELYHLQLQEESAVKLLVTLLRSYPGLMSQYTVIDEKMMAMRSHITVNDVIAQLKRYHKNGWIDYLPASDLPRITLLCSRLNENEVELSAKITGKLRERAVERMKAMKHYAEAKECRSKMLLRYFGENSKEDCGNCDVCLKRSKPEIRAEQWVVKIREQLSKSPLTESALILKLGKVHTESISEALSWMLDNGVLEQKKGLLHLTSSN